MNRPIYLDYAATTPMDPRVVGVMTECLTLDGNFANPASRSHRLGWQAEEAVENARRQVADLINADPREVVWTSGATEANNLAIKGIAQTIERGHFITSAMEHKAVLDCFAWLEQQGHSVTCLKPSSAGIVSVEQVSAAITKDTKLVSLMQVNNELGVINPISEVGALCRSRGILLHVDAAQSIGKVSVDVVANNIDLLSISAHKIYGPKGMGALFVRRQGEFTLAAQIHGGGHERGMRSGTLATHQIVAMGCALDIARTELGADFQRVQALEKQLLAGLASEPEVTLNAESAPRIPNILNLRFTGFDGDRLMMVLRDLAVSSGSACTSASVEPSHVLTAIGLNRTDAHSSLRFSIGRFTQAADIDRTVTVIKEGLTKLRALSD